MSSYGETLHASSGPRARATRTGILDAAWDLIAARGAEVSMAEIAVAAGVSRQAVYLHFKSRGGLLMELVKRADERFHIREDLEKALAIPDPRKRLESWLRAWFVFVARIHPVARDLVRLRPTDKDAAAAWDDRMSDLQSWLRVLTASLKKEGALAPGWSVKDAADYLWVSSSVPAWDLFVAECGWGESKVAKTLVARICQVLLADSADGGSAPA